MKRLLFIAFTALSIHAIAQTNIFPTSGNVGIGTTTPLNGINVFKLNDYNGGSIRFGYSGTNDGLLSLGWNPSASRDAMKFSYFPHNSLLNQIDLMTLDINGNVGIGTSNPIWKFVVSKNNGPGLEIDPDIGTIGKIGVYAYNRSNSTYLPLYFEDSQYELQGGNVGIGALSPAYKTVISNDGGTGIEIGPAGIQFSEGVGIQAYNRKTSLYTPFQIYSSKLILQGGNIGIGTPSPAYKTVISNDGGAGIEIDPAGIQFSEGVGIQAYNRKTSLYTPFQIYSSKLILQGGNVGIGTLNPAYKLDVLGTIRAKEVLVNLDGGADFIFEKDYKLPTIEHVANYVQENKHLPDIPSANEMVKNGVSMGDMQVKLLQKVEELTLYAIEQNKSKKELEAKLSKQENQYNALLEKVEMLTKQIEKR